MFLPWTLLVLPLLLRKNRSVAAAAIVVPALVVYVPWFLLAAWNPEGIGQLEGVVAILIVSVGVLFLLSPWLTARRGWQTCVRGLAVVCLVVLLGFVGLAAGRPEAIRTMLVDGRLWFLPLFFGGTLVAGLALAGRSCARRHTPLRFALWLALWLGFVGVVLLVSFSAIAAAGARGVSELVFSAFVGGVYGFAFFLLLLPFLVLIGFNRTYRERFVTALRLPESAPSPLRGRRFPPFF